MRRSASRLLHVLALAAGAAILTGGPGPSAYAKAAPVPPPYVVAIDAGHGGAPDDNHPDQLYDSGAVAGGLVEKDLTLGLAHRVKHSLEADGVSVVITRDTDVYLDLATRLAKATAGGAKLFVSIHFNYFGDPAVEGSLVMYQAADSAPFAQLMATALDQGLRRYGVASNGIVLNDGLWIHHTVPTVTVEGAYLTNAHDAAVLKQPATLDAYAVAIRAGIEAQAPEIQRLKRDAVVRRAAAAKAAAQLAAERKVVHLPTWLPWAGALVLAAAGLYGLRGLAARGLAAAFGGVSGAANRAAYPRRRARRRRRARASLRDLPTLQPRRRER
jgi:N-acetylmuramoyl-L-alanine amidase